MKRPNWATAHFVGASDEQGNQTYLADDLNEADLSWLCGCGRSKPYTGSKAYPICECGLRMRLLDHARLGYRR